MNNRFTLMTVCLSVVLSATPYVFAHPGQHDFSSGDGFAAGLVHVFTSGYHIVTVAAVVLIALLFVWTRRRAKSRLP